MQFHRVSAHWGLQLGWHLRDRVLTKLKTCVYMSDSFGVRSGRAPAPAGCLCSPPRTGLPSPDIGSGERDTTAMCERSVTVNISLAVSCPPCQHSHLTEAQTLAGWRLFGGRNGKLQLVSALIIFTEVKLSPISEGDAYAGMMVL